jgi:hypothetical protein
MNFISLEKRIKDLKYYNYIIKENLDSNKSLINENQKKSHFNENTLVLEKLKELSMEENKELKKNLIEKTETNLKLIELNKQYENQFKEFQDKIMKLDQKQKDFSFEELKKKDELINFLKSSLDKTEKSLEEQEHFMTKIFYELAVNYINIKNQQSLIQNNINVTQVNQ